MWRTVKGLSHPMHCGLKGMSELSLYDPTFSLKNQHTTTKTRAITQHAKSYAWQSKLHANYTQSGENMLWNIVYCAHVSLGMRTH